MINSLAELSQPLSLIDGETRVGDLKPLAHKIAGPRCVTLQNRIVGWLIEDVVPIAPPETLARSLTIPITCAIDIETPVRQAAQLMVKAGAASALLVKDGKAIGILSAVRLMGELGHSWDPLTGLHLSDALRDWGEKHLAVGQEISLIFIDLNDFGQYNKRYSHLIGDKVLQALAQRLRVAVKPERDLLVRFGGDEFAIGTLLDHKSAVELGMQFQSAPLIVDGVAEPVRLSVGVAGGRRTHGRPSVHSPANMDDLISQASKACLALKSTMKAGGAGGNLYSALLTALAQTGASANNGVDAVMSIDDNGNKQLTVMVPGENGQPSWVESPLTTELESAISDALRRSMKIE